MRSWRRAVLGVALLAAVAIAGIMANFALLRLTQDSNEPVGKLSPRAVFIERQSGIATVPGTTTSDDDGGRADGDD